MKALELDMCLLRVLFLIPLNLCYVFKHLCIFKSFFFCIYHWGGEGKMKGSKDNGWWRKMTKRVDTLNNMTSLVATETWTTGTCWKLEFLCFFEIDFPKVLCFFWDMCMSYYFWNHSLTLFVRDRRMNERTNTFDSHHSLFFFLTLLNNSRLNSYFQKANSGILFTSDFLTELLSEDTRQKCYIQRIY